MSEFPYKTVSVSGPDAFEFLQAQLAADLSDLPEGGLAAWCNPKGRVICLFRVAKSGDDFLLAVPAGLADDVVRRLMMFRFRSKVEFEIGATDPGHLGAESGYDDWRLKNLVNGIPEILQEQSEEFTPHMLNLDLLGAVSLTKGCYPGQEIVARTHYRGKTKRRCLLFRSSAPVAVGDKVSDGQRDIGEVLNAIGNNVLAVVPIGEANQQLMAGSATLLHSPLSYIEEMQDNED
jgi:folate-binding protein YgfZ